MSTDLCHSTRKSSRMITKSQRARESGGTIPKIDTFVANMAATPPPSDRMTSEPLSVDHSALSQHDHSPDPLQTANDDRSGMKQTAKARPQTKLGVRKKKSTAQRLTKRKYTKKDNPDTASTLQSPPEAMPTGRMPPSTYTLPATRSQPQQQVRPPGDLLMRMGLRIYTWPTPAPSSPDTISAAHRAWKENQDYKEALVDFDEDLDDWFVKSGNADAYSTVAPGASLQYSIARSFINRAKREYRLGTTWTVFEDHELAIDSMSEARRIRDPVLRAIHTKEAVDNDLRLKIFQQIRHRLCHEIWLQHYPENRCHMTMDAHGHVIVETSSETLDEPGAEAPGGEMVDLRGARRLTGEKTPASIHGPKSETKDEKSLLFQLAFREQQLEHREKTSSSVN